MSAGGYIFRKVDLTYDPSTNGATVTTWAQAIHHARCQAFFDATQAYNSSIGEVYSWATLLQNNGYGNTYPLINLPNTAGGAFITQDIHNSVSNSTYENCPAFVTVFKHEATNSIYTIITYSGFNCYSTYGENDPLSYGLYLPITNVLRNTSNYVCCGQSCAHCFAKSGGITINPVNIKNDNFLVNNCTHIMAAYSKMDGYPTSYNQSSTSLVYNRYSNGINSSDLVGKTFQFGYAIKGEQFISMMRRSDTQVWQWSIIGDIFGTTMADGDTSYVGGLVNNYYTYSYGEVGAHDGQVSTNNGNGLVSFCKADGNLYRPGNVDYIYCDYTRSMVNTINPCARTNKVIPDDTLYNAITVGAYCTNFNASISDFGVDGAGNGCKGFIDTDLLRMVSAGVCQNGATLFQGQKFISMKVNSDAYSGFLLGWDTSNTANML